MQGLTIFSATHGVPPGVEMQSTCGAVIINTPLPRHYPVSAMLERQTSQQYADRMQTDMQADKSVV